MPDRVTHTQPEAHRRVAHVRGGSAFGSAISQALRDDGWTLAVDDAAAHWLVEIVPAAETDAGALLARLRAFASRSAPGPTAGILLILDLSHATSRAGELPPPFREAATLRGVLAAIPLLALEAAPRLRVNAIGVLPPSAQLAEGTPPADIAAAVRFVIDAPALTGQMIALDGGRTALVPAPGLGKSDQT